MLDKVRKTRESWSIDLGDVGKFEIEYDCIKAYHKTGEVDEIAKKYKIDAEIVLQVLHVIAEEMGVPKKEWYKHDKPATKEPPKEKKTIAHVHASLVHEKNPLLRSLFPSQ